MTLGRPCFKRCVVLFLFHLFFLPCSPVVFVPGNEELFPECTAQQQFVWEMQGLSRFYASINFPLKVLQRSSQGNERRRFMLHLPSSSLMVRKINYKGNNDKAITARSTNAIYIANFGFFFRTSFAPFLFRRVKLSFSAKEKKVLAYFGRSLRSRPLGRSLFA